MYLKIPFGTLFLQLKAITQSIIVVEAMVEVISNMVVFATMKIFTFHLRDSSLIDG